MLSANPLIIYKIEIQQLFVISIQLYFIQNIGAMSNQIMLNIQNSKHWDEQVAYLQQIKVDEVTARSMNCPKNTTVIRNMLANTRSKVVTSTLEFLIDLFDKEGPLMHTFAINLLGTDSIFKLINSSNKLIFASVHQLIKSIVVNSPHPKLYAIFASQFNSKNVIVRECISSYLLVLADTVQIPSNFLSVVRNWKNDPSKVVRQNLVQLQQIISKQNSRKKKQKIEKTLTQNKQNINTQKEKKLKQKSSSAQNSQIIKQSFIKNNESVIIQDLQSNIDFLITKIQSSQAWTMKIFAIQELSHIFHDFADQLEEKLYVRIVNVFLHLLDEKRSRVNLHMGQMIMKSIQCNQQLFNKIVANQFPTFAQKSVKIDEFGSELISIVIDLDPSKYIVQLGQITVDIKSLKQKIILMDLLVVKVCEHPLHVSKASTLMKLMCKNIQKFHSNKDVYLPCLAVLSHFKVTYPNQFFSSLICLQKDLLNKIILIAQAIDPQLRESIISYIHSLKNPDKVQKNDSVSQIKHSVDLLSLSDLLYQVTSNEEDSVTKLVQFVFENKEKVSVRQFYQIIKLTQKVSSQDSLLQLQLLLEQICKSENEKFLEALFQAVASCNENSIEAQYMIAYLRKILTLFSNFAWMKSQKYVTKLISLYRISKCPKVRLLCIKNLALFANEEVIDNVSPKQKQLIEAQHRLQSNHLST